MIEANYKKHLDKVHFEIDTRGDDAVMVVSGGYPEAYEKGKTITGIEDVSESIIFHAGTALKQNTVVTNGGRVIAVTSMDADYKKAIKKSYQSIAKLSFDRMNFRTDIGFDL